jgi:hypothetical protein
LARKSNSLSLYYEWCANPLDCIVRWFLLGFFLVPFFVVFFGSGLGLSTFVYFVPICGWSTSCTFLLKFYNIFAVSKKKQNIKVMIMEKCFYN